MKNIDGAGSDAMSINLSENTEGGVASRVRAFVAQYFNSYKIAGKIEEDNEINQEPEVGDKVSARVGSFGIDKDCIDINSLQFNGYNVELIITNEAGVVSGKLTYNPRLKVFEISQDFSYMDKDVLDKSLTLANTVAFLKGTQLFYEKETYLAEESLKKSLDEASLNEEEKFKS